MSFANYALHVKPSNKWNDSVFQQNVLQYHSATQELANISDSHFSWINGKAPSGEPSCGYDGECLVGGNTAEKVENYLL
jgi:hypothetical protein